MSKNYSVAEARAHLADILDEVETGRDVQITRRGRAAAVVLSTQKYEALSEKRSSFRDAYRRFLQHRSKEGPGLDTKYFESLRERSSGRRVRL